MLNSDLLGTIVSLSRNRKTVVYECRRCGASLDSSTDDCTYCGPTTVVRYDIQ